MIKQYDIVIVGSGIGGLSTLLYLTETDDFKNGLISIAIIAKGALDCTNTSWAQGGIAAVEAIGDNFESHINDTLIAGANTNNKEIVNKVVRAAPELMKDLIRWGTNFDKNFHNEIDLAREGGHSAARIWHYQDQTGQAIEQALLAQLYKFPNVDILEYTQVTQIIQIQNGFFQIQLYQLNNAIFQDIISCKLVLATGGLGMLYEKTTNQKLSTGDGIYFAKKLGATIKDLSLIQFHPTGLAQEGNIAFLISEALRGAGAVLRNNACQTFMANYDERADLAPRDIVSRAILEEMNKTGTNHVYLDATKVDTYFLEAHFPNIKRQCLDICGIDIEKNLIPIIPVQHYSCGGILVNEFGESTIPNLYAIGEVACTGLHGANRLASNSLLEAIAFAKFSINKLLQISKCEINTQPLALKPNFKNIDIRLLQQTMSKYAGVIKTNQQLSKALEILLKIKSDAILENVPKIEFLQNEMMLELAIDLLDDAISQKENKGVHFNLDLV